MTSNNAQPQDDGTDTGLVPEATSTTTPRGRLRRLKINRFRHVKPGTELHFDEGINVLLGRNGTGKTTLLELICAVASGDLRAYQREDFDLEFELLLNGEILSISTRNEIAQRRGPTEFIGGNDRQNTLWKYHIYYSTSDGSRYEIEAAMGKTQLAGSGHAQLTLFPEAPLFSRGFYENGICLALNIGSTNFNGFREQSLRFTNNLFRMDEGLDVFRALTEGLPLPRTGRQLAAHLFSGLPSENSKESVLSLLGLLTSYVPPSLVEQLLERGDSAHSATEMSISNSQWEFLQVLQTLFNVRRMQVTLQLVERKDSERHISTSTFGKPVFRATTHRGTTFTHDQLSYGEKRLLAFMYHAAANPQILVADELVNGLHHEWIQACLDVIQGQAFLTSQNPLLLDHLSFESAEEVQRRFVLCSADESGEWTWCNMDIEDADAFYRAYEVGLQHVGEILRTSGLW